MEMKEERSNACGKEMLTVRLRNRRKRGHEKRGMKRWKEPTT